MFDIVMNDKEWGTGNNSIKFDIKVDVTKLVLLFKKLFKRKTDKVQQNLVYSTRFDIQNKKCNFCKPEYQENLTYRQIFAGRFAGLNRNINRNIKTHQKYKHN